MMAIGLTDAAEIFVQYILYSDLRTVRALYLYCTFEPRPA
jgi:uncharacterized membrane protein